MVGAFTIGVIRNALNLHNVNAFYQLIAIGVVVLIAVEADVIRGYVEGRVSRGQCDEAPVSTVTEAPTLEVRNASKRFGAVVGLDGVDIHVRRGEVLALLGDNGAGKSTLIKCLSGALRLDHGAIEMEGVPVVIHSPADARHLGIETVYQDLALVDNDERLPRTFYARSRARRARRIRSPRSLQPRRAHREMRRAGARCAQLAPATAR